MLCGVSGFRNEAQGAAPPTADRVRYQSYAGARCPSGRVLPIARSARGALPLKRPKLGTAWTATPVARCGSAGGWPFLGSALARFGRPGPQARAPGRHGAPVRGVLLAVARAQRRLFVAPHEPGDDEPERGRVREQERASENERLAHEC